MSIRIEVKSTDLHPREVTQRGTGKVFKFLEQTAWAHTTDPQGNPNPYPEKITVSLPRGVSEPYAAGDYTLHPASFYVGQFGSLEMSPRLVPVKSRG